MKKFNYIITCCYIFVILSSCSKHYQLKKNDLNFFPYKGNEALVFQSDKNRMDTTFLKGFNKINGCATPISFFSDKCDGIILNCTRTDPNYDRYLVGKQLVEIIARKNGETYISFQIMLKGSWFYGNSFCNLSEFDKMQNTELIIENKIYKDVKVFEASDYSKQFEQRANYVEKFYWSVSQGLLGLDRRDEKWRLIKIYLY